MKYFLMQTDPLYVDAPVLQDWRGKVDRTKIKPGLSHQLPARIILNIYPNAHTTFTDIVDFPFLLLSKTCMDVVNCMSRRLYRSRSYCWTLKTETSRPIISLSFLTWTAYLREASYLRMAAN